MSQFQVLKSDYFGQDRFTGTITVDEPMGILILANDNGGCWFMKVPKSSSSTRNVDASFHVLTEDRVQVIVRIDDAVLAAVIWPAQSYEVFSSGSFTEGTPYVFAETTDHSQSVHILGISSVKLRNLRKRIWRIKDQYVDTLPTVQKEILFGSRHGYVQSTT